MRKTRVLIVCIEKVSSVVVGVLEPLKALEEQDKLEVQFIKTIDVTPNDIAWCDVLICVRGSEYADVAIVKAAKKAGRKTIYFLDDDLLNIPQDVSCTLYYNDEYVKKYITKLLEICDILWAVNPNIIEKYGVYFEKAILVDACACEIAKYEEKESSPVKFIYAGGIDHEKIVREKLSGNIKKLCEEYGERVYFTFIGVDPGLKDMSQVKYIPYVENYYEYKKIMNESGFHISFAIVNDTPFYSCKYFNKFLEYSSIGAVGIYSALEPYTFIIEDKVNGILCDDNEEEWYNAMKFLIENDDIRNKIAKNAYELLCERFTPIKVGEDIVGKISELTTFAAKKIEASTVKISKLNSRIMFYLQRTTLLFRRYGILAVFILPFKSIKILFKILKKDWE